MKKVGTVAGIVGVLFLVAVLAFDFGYYNGINAALSSESSPTSGIHSTADKKPDSVVNSSAARLPDSMELPFIAVDWGSTWPYCLILGIYKSEGVYISVRAPRVEVKLRADGEKYTTVFFKDLIDIKSSDDVIYDSALILAPQEEDVKLWQKELELMKMKYREWRDNHKLYPRRVLPPRRDIFGKEY